MASEGNNINLEPTLVNSRWSLVQFGLLASYTIGFHGLTSLPYYIHKHSGLFLVAYYVLVVLICIPVAYVQIKLGALFKRGIVGIFGILVPILKGAAVSILILTYIRCLLHGVELSYAVYFALASLQFPLPWAYNTTALAVHDSPADKYFHEDFLQKTEHIGEGGYVVWYIALCLLLTWLVIYLLTFRGTALIAKVAYVLTPLTVLLMLIILVYGYIAIPDSTSSIGRLLNSQGEVDQDTKLFHIFSKVNSRLGHPRPWIDAIRLHINSLGLWSGILPTLGTLVYNRKYVVNASWILLLLVYSILPQIGMLALASYIDPHDSGGFIAESKGIKPGLPFLFVAIPTTFGRLELSPLMSCLLFTCILLFGLHHQALHLITIWENLLPSTPKFIMTYFRRRECLVAAACGVSFMLSIPYAIQGGIHLYSIINDYVDRLVFALIIISTVPFLVGYIKQEVLYIPIERACVGVWYGLASLISTVLLLYYFTVYVYPEPVVGSDQRWAEHLGWCVAVAPVLIGLVGGAIHAVWKQKGSFKQKFIQSLRSESFNVSESSNEYTSAETGDTVLQNNPPVEEEIQEQEVVDKTETEVFVQPSEETEPARV